MVTSPWRRAFPALLRAAPLLLLTPPFLPDRAMAQDRSEGPVAERRALLGVFHLNPDCHRDTIIGRIDQGHRWRPWSIRWGRDRSDSTGSARGVDSLDPCFTRIPDALRVRESIIAYPEWRRFGLSLSVQPINEDSLADLVFYLWGAVRDTSAARDSVRPVVVFGQHGLDTLDTIRLSSITSFSTSPFIAMELRVGSEIAGGRARDPSRRSSYRVNRIRLDVGRPDTTDDPRGAPHVSATPPEVRVYPNPGSTTTHLLGRDLPAGLYTVEVVATNGGIMLRYDEAIGDEGFVLRPVDLRRLSSGLYIVRLTSRDRFVGTYPISVTR